MPIRLSGLSSGLDTESIISQLVEVKKTKVSTVKKEQISAQYKQDAWKELNTKLRNLMNKHVSNMRWSSSYSKKTTAVSNSSVASVITGEEAMNGVQSLRVSKLAKTAYLTGAQIKTGSTGEKWTALSKISDVCGSTFKDGAVTINTDNGVTELNINSSTTISDVLTSLKDVGLNANFDATNQRFFVSAGSSGEEHNFSITASDSNGDAILSALGLKVSLSQDETALAEYTEYAGYYVAGDKDATIANMSSVIASNVSDKVDFYLNSAKTLMNNKTAAEKTIADIRKQYTDEPLKTVAEYEEEIKNADEKIAELEEKISAETDKDKQHLLAVERDNLKTRKTELTSKKKDASTVETQEAKIASYDAKLSDIREYVDITSAEKDGETVYSATAKDKLTNEIQDVLYKKAEYAAKVMTDYDPDNDASTGATKVKGQDAEIYLNEARFTSSGNTINVNGLTITALSETAKGETVTITTKDDTDGIYGMIKDFIKEYNAIVNEMDKLYNAPSTSYEPLLDEEKDKLSDSEVEKWEQKIKDSILRRDDNINSVNSALQSVMSSGIMVNGKTMYLSDFGISTMSYLLAADNEKHAYHIDGDPDDGTTSSNADKLKSMIASDPDTVISFFSQLGNNLYQKMNSLSSSVAGYRSFGTFYNDKKMTSEYDAYKTKISEMEESLRDYEDKWYSKFAAMEKALAKLQSNTSAVTSMLGMK